LVMLVQGVHVVMSLSTGRLAGAVPHREPPPAGNI
jgi:hypothetical protein